MMGKEDGVSDDILEFEIAATITVLDFIKDSGNDDSYVSNFSYV